MRNYVASLVMTAGLALAAAPAFAGNFEIWTDSSAKGGVTMLVSFAGDGLTEDAQVDFNYPTNLKFVRADVKVPGSICAAFPSENKVRVVPPSGAGTPLSTAATDYCSFSFSGKGAAAAKFKPSFVECAAPTGSSKCNADVNEVSAK